MVRMMLREKKKFISELFIIVYNIFDFPLPCSFALRVFLASAQSRAEIAEIAVCNIVRFARANEHLAKEQRKSTKCIHH